MQSIRVFFSKTGDVKFLSHLDVMRCFTRALKRSKLNVWYTQGFNSHIYLMFASPLSLGFESEYETMDFRIEEDDTVDYSYVTDILNSLLPEGLHVFRCAAPVHQHTDVAFSQWDIKVYGAGEQLYTSFSSYIGRSELPIQKTTKKGKVKTENAIEYIKSINYSYQEDHLQISAVIKSSTESALNPSLLISTFAESFGLQLENTEIVRKKLLLDNLQLFE